MTYSGELCQSQFLENRAARRYPAVNAIARYSNNLFDRPFFQGGREREDGGNSARG